MADDARRDAIAKVVEPFVEQAMGPQLRRDYGSWYDEDGMLDAILALPIEQARDRVIEAARLLISENGDSSDDLYDAIAELDALEAL